MGLSSGFLKTVRPLILLSLIFLLAGCSQGGFPLSQSFDIGTHRLFIECIGSGAPVVVIDVGVGDSFENWRAVREQLALNTTVCAYDRAGYGKSEPGPLPRSSLQAALELKLLLEASAQPGPYLLVGHSLGGLNLQVFAAQYPDVTAGLVLLDPTPVAWLVDPAVFPELSAMFQQQVQEMNDSANLLLQSENPAEKTQGVFLQALASEHAELFGETARQVAEIVSFGDLPLVVIGSGQSNPAFGASADAFQEFWITQNQELAQRSSAGRFVLAEDSGHMIYIDAPETVIIAVRDMLEKLRSF